MQTEIVINGLASPTGNYITWSPVKCQIRLTQADGAADPVRVRLRNRNPQRGGQVQFFSAIPAAGQNELQLDLPVNGAPVPFFIAGQFGRPSTANRDASIEVTTLNDGSVLSRTSLMVRIRKNANTLTTAERNRFVSVLARLNNQGTGGFQAFREMHVRRSQDEAHGFAAFLPWHRAYLLDLERELQKIDPSVTLPYWRYDEPAPRLFNRAFLGVGNQNGAVTFSSSNPLQFWKTDQDVGVIRRPSFNTLTSQASYRPFPNGPLIAVLNEATTLLLGGANNRYADFLDMEDDPHGAAHVSFDVGYITSIGTSAKAPLFFLLHANVDRLWAKWQWFNRRFDVTSRDTYSRLGSAQDPGADRIGHNLRDTMWPWNQVTTGLRPPTAPGGQFPPSPISPAPGLTPTVGSMIDFQGVMNRANRLGFDYDDVPFEF